MINQNKENSCCKYIHKLNNNDNDDDDDNHTNNNTLITYCQ